MSQNRSNHRSGHWHVEGNQVQLYITETDLRDYSRDITGAVLYGLLRRGDWVAYLNPDIDPIFIMLVTQNEVHHYKIRSEEFSHFLHYYCNGKFERKIDWRKCGF